MWQHSLSTSLSTTQDAWQKLCSQLLLEFFFPQKYSGLVLLCVLHHRETKEAELENAVYEFPQEPSLVVDIFVADRSIVIHSPIDVINGLQNIFACTARKKEQLTTKVAQRTHLTM